MKIKKNTIIITGGAGFVGSNLIEYFLNKTNIRILSLDNYSSGSKKITLKIQGLNILKGILRILKN